MSLFRRVWYQSPFKLLAVLLRQDHVLTGTTLPPRIGARIVRLGDAEPIHRSTAGLYLSGTSTRASTRLPFSKMAANFSSSTVSRAAISMI
jgi:fermentation-respiration switch protein FrsA (DUF1100 family)